MFAHCQCAIWLKFNPGDPFLPSRQLAVHGALPRLCAEKRAAEPRRCRSGWWWVRTRGWGSRFWFALLARFASLHCLPAWFAALCLLSVVSALAGHPFWFVFVPAEGNRFALGTGGIRWSLLVGGLGPVLSIPKLCFKPFRKNEWFLLV